MEILKQMEEREQRWNVYIDKVIVRMNEFCAEAIQPLKETFQSDTDKDKRGYKRLLASVEGQMTIARKKVDSVEREQIQKLREKGETTIPIDLPEYDIFDDIVSRCSDKLEEFEDKWDQWIEKLEKTNVGAGNVLEEKYQAILKEYNLIKAKFKCTQCGSPVSVDKIFFTSTYIQCPSCSTQNTFEPSSQAKELIFLAPELAESRVAHILERHEELSKEYEKMDEAVHLMQLEKDSSIDKEDAERGTRIGTKMQMGEIGVTIEKTYKQYLRAKYDELNKIIPDLKEQHEAKYALELKEYLTQD